MASGNAEPRPPELTARAVVAGASLGVVFAIGNVYVGLKTGLSDAATVTTAILGFALFKSAGKRPYSALENNITQSVASSAAMMPAAMGFLGSFPALAMMGKQYSAWVLGGWGLAVGLLGVLLALPLRERFLGDGSMPFPFAVATAEVIRAMHRSGARAITKARALLASGAASAVVTWFRDEKPQFVPAVVHVPWGIGGIAASTLGLGLNASPLLVALGMLVGPRTGLGLFVGAIAAWAVIAPWLVLAHVVAPAYDALGAWLMWPGVALMVAGAATPVARDYKLLARSIRDLGALGSAFGRRAIAAPALLAIALVVVGWRAFELSPLIVGGGIALSAVMAVVVGRSSGETGCMPLLSVGQISQLLLGPAARTAAGSILGASIPAGDSGQTGQTLETLKVGQLLGASPRSQIAAQLTGALVGAPVAVGAYLVLLRAHPLGGPNLPAPGASPWKAVADLVAEGTARMPPHALFASLVALALGVLLAALEPTRFARFVPSPLAMGLAFVLGAAPSFTIAAGALAHALLRRARPAWTDDVAPSVAVGGLVGEALTGIVIASLLVANVLGGP